MAAHINAHVEGQTEQGHGDRVCVQTRTAVE